MKPRGSCSEDANGNKDQDQGKREADAGAGSNHPTRSSSRFITAINQSYGIASIKPCPSPLVPVPDK